jgi:hypothetical protein
MKLCYNFILHIHRLRAFIMMAHKGKLNQHLRKLNQHKINITYFPTQN